MEFTAKQIASVIDGQIEGDEDVIVSTLSKIEAGKKGSISFLSNSKYNNYLYETDASIVIVNASFVPEKSVKTTLIKVADAYQAFTMLLTYYNQAKLQKVGIDQTAIISKSAKLGKDIYIAPLVYIGKNVQLGDNVKIYPNVFVGDNVSIESGTTLFSGVKIYDDCSIGSNCTLHANAVIGADGFGFAPKADRSYSKIPQIGNVIIGNDVEIGAGTTVDRATLGSTRIGDGVKLDNLVQIAHNVEIGNHTVIAALTGVAGSAKIGKYCVIGGQVGISGHITIGDNCKIQGQSGVGKNLKNGAVVQGSPAFDYSNWYRSYVHFKNLPKTINNIESDIKDLKKQ